VAGAVCCVARALRWIDVSEPLRDRIDGEIAAIEATAAELERVLDEAIDELL
jgi:hypothetical protein